MIDRYEEIYGQTSIRPRRVGTTEQCQKDGCCDVTIIDRCAGELLDYGACARQASRIVDTQTCIDACNEEKELDSTKDCGAICSQDIRRPWYAEGCVKQGRTWLCPNLLRLFDRDLATAKGGVGALGLQPGGRKVRTMGSAEHPSRLTKFENPSRIQTQTSANWRDETTRTLLYQQHQGSRAEQDVTSTVSDEGVTRTWTTDW